MRWASEDIDLPQVTARPCNECPWVRTAKPGHLGPHTAEKWTDIAHSESPIACHMTIEHNEQDWMELRQCAGSAIYRANIMKHPHNPDIAVADDQDKSLVFAWDDEFIEHHTGVPKKDQPRRIRYLEDE